VPDGSVVLPKFNHELVEENNVGKISILEMPQPEPATIIQILIISISSSLAAMVLTAVIFLIIWKCKRSAQRQPSIENMQIPPFIPVPNQPELRFLEYHD
jgi:heme/copper-type cytochrome/quinol oxidase subunit 2